MFIIHQHKTFRMLCSCISLSPRNTIRTRLYYHWLLSWLRKRCYQQPPTHLYVRCPTLILQSVSPLLQNAGTNSEAHSVSNSLSLVLKTGMRGVITLLPHMPSRRKLGRLSLHFTKQKTEWHTREQVAAKIQRKNNSSTKVWGSYSGTHEDCIRWCY